MPYLGRGPGFGIRQRYFYTASADDTSVSGSDNNGITLSFTDTLFVDVFLNGVLLDPNSDYNTTTANTIAGFAALSADDFIEVIVFDSFSIGDVVPASSGGTFSGAITVNNNITSTATVTGVTGTFSGDVSGLTLNATGDTSSGDNAALGYTAAEGLILTGQGSTNDVTIKNDADTAVIQIPTGGTATTFAGDVSVLGTTPTLTIGDAGAEDAKIVFDGNAQDFHVGLDDSADDLVIGLGSALGTTPAISIDENLLVTVEDDVKVDGRAVGHVTTDNDGSFDLAVGNDFICTSAGNLALTFTNAAAGQSGNIKFVNGSNHTITAHADVAINESVLSTISASGTYHLSYFCSAASGNDTILVSASAILT